MVQVDLTEQDKSVGKSAFIDHYIMLPHEMISSMYDGCSGLFHYIFTGVPGELEKYWLYNSDLAESLEIMADQFAHHVPLRLYGDGADARGRAHFELYSILPVLSCSGSTLDSRLLVCVRNTNTTTHTRQTICQILAWSFSALRDFDESIDF